MAFTLAGVLDGSLAICPGWDANVARFVEGACRDMAASLLNDVRPRAQAALANSPFYELHDLRVDDRGGALTISGTVTSFYHKQLAQEVVRSVCKEIEIVNTIHVSDEVGVGLGD